MLDDLAPYGEVMPLDDPLRVMISVAKVNPVYSPELNESYIERMFKPPAEAGNVITLKFPDGVAFFSWLYPLKPLMRPQDFTARAWVEKGPVLWIGDVCCTPEVNGTRLGKAVRHWVREYRLAREGEKAVFWRPQRLGYFTVR